MPTTWKFQFGENTIYEGRFYDLIENTPIIIYKDELHYGKTLRVHKNFAVRIQYRSNYTKENNTEVYESRIEHGKRFILHVNAKNGKKDRLANTKNALYTYDDTFIHTRENRLETIAYIKMFDKISDSLDNGIYYSNA